MAVPKRAIRVVWIGVLFLVVIGVAAVTRRFLVLLWPQSFTLKNSPTVALDRGFARHAALTLVHILPGALFLMLAPFQFAARFRAKHLQLHRWVGRVLVITGLIVGVSALIMSFTLNIGGVNETAATTLYSILFLICLIKAYAHIRRREVARHREWMIRAFGIGLGVATTRPIVGAFFATRRLAPHEFFGIAFWLGLTITAIVAEGWVEYTRTHARSNDVGSLRSNTAA